MWNHYKKYIIVKDLFEQGENETITFKTFDKFYKYLNGNLLNVEVYDYDKVTQCDLIGKIEFKASSVDYGIVRDYWYNIKSGKIHLITHLSDQNKPAFISESFMPLYSLYKTSR